MGSNGKIVKLSFLDNNFNTPSSEKKYYLKFQQNGKREMYFAKNKFMSQSQFQFK